MRRNFDTIMPIHIEMNQAALLLLGFFKEGNIKGIDHALAVYDMKAHINNPKFRDTMIEGVGLLREKQKKNPELESEYQELIDKIEVNFINPMAQA